MLGASGERRIPHRHGGVRLRLQGYAYIAPAVLFLLIVLGYPTLWAIILSLRRYDFATGQDFFLGLRNYVQALGDPGFLHSLRVTLTFWFWSVTLEFGFGLLLALLVSRSPRSTNVLRAVFILPMFVPPVVTAIVWKWMLDPQYGVVNTLLGGLGIGPIAWLGNVHLALPSLIAIDVWQYTGMLFILLLAGLQSIPSELTDMARVDGATAFQEFMHVTLPLLRPVITVALVLKTMFALRAFDVIFTTTQGGPSDATQTISIYLYKTGFNLFRLGFASALGILLLLLIVVFTALYAVVLRPQRVV